MTFHHDEKERLNDDRFPTRRNEAPQGMPLTRAQASKASVPPEEDPYADVPCTD